MAPFEPRLEDLPAEFPIFPLPGALLLPHGKLPLNIFEPRYLAMIEDSMASGRMFGMIQPDVTRNAGETGPGLYRVGCLGRVSSFSETEDGRYLITLAGVIRFEPAAELEMRRGYRRVRADFSPYTNDLTDPSSAVALFDRTTLLQALRAYFSHRGFDANWDAINQMPDDLLVITLSMVCPFEAAEKQALLEATTPTERAQVLLTVLQIDTHQAPDDSTDSSRRSRAS